MPTQLNLKKSSLKIIIMKPVFLSALLISPTFAAVTSLPTAPAGFEWQLVASSQTDSQVANLTTLESSIGMALGISASGTAPISATGSASETANLTAFGSPEPASYSVGDTVDLVTANTYSASLSIITTAGVQNGGGIVLVESKLTNVQVTSAIGSGASDSDVSSALSSDPLILVSPNATASSSTSGSFGFVQGQTVTFTFNANSELAITEPFGSSGNTHNYFVNPTVDASLRRDTIYDTYVLTEIVPEPSSLSLMALAGLGLLSGRKRS